MKKFQIFLFIEACLLTGALILMVSEHFSRFLLILFLFLLLLRYYTGKEGNNACLLYTSPSPRDQRGSRMPSSA